MTDVDRQMVSCKRFSETQLDVVLSVRPEFANGLATGTKKWEFRRRIPKRPSRYVWVYATAPLQAVIGYFPWSMVLSDEPNAVWKHCWNQAGIEENRFREYFRDCTVAHAIYVDRFYIIETSIELENLSAGLRAPQSFCYISTENVNEPKLRDLV